MQLSEAHSEQSVRSSTRYSHALDCKKSYGKCRFLAQSGSQTGRCRKLRTSPAKPLASILPVHPVHVMSLEISGDGFLNCRKEVRIAELCQQSESFQLVFHGIFEFGKA